MDASERKANDQDGGKDFEGFGPADQGANQPERHEQGGDGKNAADHGAEVAFV